MIVEIQGVDCDMLEKKFLPLLGSVDVTQRDGLCNKIVLSADTGQVRQVNTHRSVWDGGGVRIFLREPGELSVTLSGPRDKIVYVVRVFLMRRFVSAEPFLHFLNDLDALSAHQ